MTNEPTRERIRPRPVQVSVPIPREPLLRKLGRAPVTCGLALTNLAVLLVAEHYGSTTEVATLVRFGANDRSLVLAGEWWRLFTYMFLHVGWIHFFWNTYASWGWCASVERALGGWRFLVIYLAAGVGGGCASVLGHDIVSAGASGALFGIIGARLVLERRVVPSWGAFMASPLTRATLKGVGFWIVLGVLVLPMDNYAHVGGLLTGAAVTWMLTLRMGPRAPSATTG
jgi:rhomboid protease GluP